MENTRPYLTINGETFTDIYTATGIAVGSKMTLQNLSSDEMIVYIGTSPSATGGQAILPYERVVISASVTGCYVKMTSNQTGRLSVQKGSNDTLGTPVDDRVYSGYRAITVQSFTESNSKNGSQYELAYTSASVAAGANLDLVFSVGTSPVIVKSRSIVFTSNQITTAVYKDTVATGGTAVPLFCLNTQLSNTALSTAVLNPTISNVGTLASATFTDYGTDAQGNRSVGTFTTSGNERILAPNTKYLLRVTNSGSGTAKISVYASLYEGGLSVEV